MPPTPESAGPSPQLFMDTITGYQGAGSLRAALELDVFTELAEGGKSAGALAESCRTSERGMRILCDALAVFGFLTKNGAQYGLTPDSALFLNRKSPIYIGSAYQFLTSPLIVEGFWRLTEAVRKGGTALGDQGVLSPENPVWVEFARAMAPMMKLVAQRVAERLDARAGKKWKVLDVAGGHGMYGIELARENPNAEITVVDWPNVLEVAKENAWEAGVAGRYRTISGSAFDVEYGSGYDLVLLTNFLHHFDPPAIETLLKKAHAALAPGGRAVTIEFVPNEDHISPPMAATFSLVMLAGTPGGDAYTFREYEGMFAKAGFSRSEISPLSPAPSSMIVSAK